MALNGITVNALAWELNNILSGGRIQKIAQPEAHSLLLTIHTDSGQKRLYMSGNASLPLIYLTDENRPSPMQAPSFVMVLRKYIGNARILSVDSFGLERVIRLRLEHLDEMKDVAEKSLYIEIMGKHSNIIFCDENDRIIDSVKHVGSLQSSVREVLPGRDYFIPGQTQRMDLRETDRDIFYNRVLSKNGTVAKAIASAFTGFSNLTARELCSRVDIDPDIPIDTLHESERQGLSEEFEKLKQDILSHSYSPEVVLDQNGKSVEFSPFSLSLYPGNERIYTDTISAALRIFYDRRNTDNLLKQRTSDLYRIVHTCMDRVNKKLALQEKQLADTDRSEQLRLFGELLQTYGHSCPEGARTVNVINYYDNEPIDIPLDPELSGIENSKKYFEKYTKLKRTREALLPQLEHSKNEVLHLSSILASLGMCENDADISAIKKELSEYGYVKKIQQGGKGKNSKKDKKNPPLHFISEEGFEFFVGKNNYQNEEVTFKIGRGGDWWFHAKKMPGSHVILKNDGRPIPDHIFEYAANLAAYYSSGRESSYVEIDYLQKKDVKRPNGAAPGFVIYYTNYSMMAAPDISHLKPVL